MGHFSKFEDVSVQTAEGSLHELFYESGSLERTYALAAIKAFLATHGAMKFSELSPAQRRYFLIFIKKLKAEIEKPYKVSAGSQ